MRTDGWTDMTKLIVSFFAILRTRLKRSRTINLATHLVFINFDNEFLWNIAARKDCAQRLLNGITRELNYRRVLN